MKAHLRRLLSTVGNTFWILLGAMVVAGILLALGLVELERSGAIPPWLIASPWLYSGGATGARTLLGGGCIHHRRCWHSPLNYNSSVIAGSGPDGSPTASQLYPRPRQPICVRRVPWHILIRADGASQHAHAQQSEFIAYFLLSAGILLAFVCISTLVFFVGHMAGRINVDTVVSLAAEMFASQSVGSCWARNNIHRLPTRPGMKLALLPMAGAATCGSSTAKD